MRFLILHGWCGSEGEHWQAWLAGRLREAGHHVQFPVLPDPEHPCPTRWREALAPELSALADGPGERVVVAHSLGCVLWLREVAGIDPALRVDRVALVAPPCPGAAQAELAEFFPSGAQAEAVAAAATETRLVCSDDDPYCPIRGADRHWGQPLALEVDLLPGAGHINVAAGFGPWPAMEAWCLGERASLAHAEQAA